MSDVFEQGFVDLPENDEDITFKPPSSDPMKTGFYRATYAGGGSVYDGVSDKGEWHALKLPFEGFVAHDVKGLEAGDTRYETWRPLEAFMFTSDERAMLRLAWAFSLVGPDGRSLVASSREEFIEQLNSQAGTEVKVYIKSGPQKRKNPDTKKWEVQLKDDKTPWMESNILSVEPLD